MMSRYIIRLDGCDDSTEFTMEIYDENDLDILKAVAKKSQEASTYNCQPMMRIYKEERAEVDYDI